MTFMRERNLRVLEFTKIRDQLAALCLSDSGKERAKALIPSGDEKMVRLWQEQTSEAGTIMAYTGGSPMQFFPDVSGFAKIAAAGGTLSPRALLDVAEALKASRLVRAAIVTDRENTPLLTQLASHLNTHRELEEDHLQRHPVGGRNRRPGQPGAVRHPAAFAAPRRPHAGEAERLPSRRAGEVPAGRHHHPAQRPLCAAGQGGVPRECARPDP